jgi:hypothetical protein
MKNPKVIATKWILIGGVSGFLFGFAAKWVFPSFVPEGAPILAALVGLASTMYAATYEAFIAGQGNRGNERTST